MTYTFHPTQETNAKKIYDAICVGYYYILFHLRMQGGKTGSYLKVALDLLFENKIDHVIIIGGYNDIALREQLKEDAKNAIKEYAMEKYPRDSRLCENLKNKLDESIKVYTGTELKKNNLLKDNTLIIHDESHYASSKNNVPFKKFYKQNNIEKTLCGDFTQLKKKNIRIISVGATSFAEQICDAKISEESCEFEKKKIIYGEVGENYNGIAEYLENDKIIFENDPNKILSKITLMEGYIIIRTHDFKTDIKCIADKYNMNYKNLSGGEGANAFEFLKDKPSKITVVQICGLARMGKVLYKKYIQCVIETSKKPNIDTILQALPGRMCGYDTNPNIKIYVASNTQDDITKYSKNELCEISRAMNVKGKKTKNTYDYYVKDKSGKG